MIHIDELIEFIRQQSGAGLIKIDASTEIENGLGVTGNDGYELINSYGRKFGVDVSEFNYSKYFYPEPSPYFSMKERIQPLTVRDLYEGIIVGKLR